MVRMFRRLRDQRLPPAYMPPPLDIRVRLRNPGDRPQPVMGYDELNRPIRLDAPPQDWGVEVWAHRHDRLPFTRNYEDSVILEQVSVFTIRRRTDITADVQVVDGEDVFDSIGPPVRRGGAGSGRAAEYLEIHARLRT